MHIAAHNHQKQVSEGLLGYNLNVTQTLINLCNLVFPVGYRKTVVFKKHFEIKMAISICLELTILN